MASNQEVRIPLKYWVDNEKKRVVMAEASGDFVDVLFSLLTLPLGTIIRLGNKFRQPVDIGCINNLYKHVEGLSSDVFWNDTCQKMLLRPRNPLEESLKGLKVKVDDTEPTKYFTCHNCARSSNLLLSTFADGKCNCGKLMRKEMELHLESKDKQAGENGVFVREDAMFFIFDNLRVIRSSPSNFLQTPPLARHKNFSSKLVEMSRDVGTNEIFCILKNALTSKSPLSDVFLRNRESKPSFSSSRNIKTDLHLKSSIEIKVTVSKSKNKILFAEADGDFVDFLVSFLTTPLGSILNLTNGKLSFRRIRNLHKMKKLDPLSLGSIRNLYRSAKRLDPSWFIGSSNKSLLNPRVAPQHGCKNNPLSLEEDTPKYWYGTVEAKNKGNEGRIMISKRKDLLRDPTEMKLFEPRCRDGAKESAKGFIKRPCLFVVTDDLKVIPMTTNSSIQFLQQQEVQFHDVEERLVKISTSHEALNLVRASLTSKEGALTKSLMKKWWYFQSRIPFRKRIRRVMMRYKK